MSRKWGYLVYLYGTDDNGSAVEMGKFEVEGISPFKIVSGHKADVMKSEEYDHFANAMAMGDFVGKIGNKNTLSVKALRGDATNSVAEVKRNNESFYGIRLETTPLSGISPKLSGKARLTALNHNALESVRLKTVMVTSFWTVIYAKGNSQKTYDFITFEGEETIFGFQGKDW